MKEISVGSNADCHATFLDNRYLYIVTYDGLYCIDQNSLEIVKVVDTGKIYATNALLDGNSLLLHDECGGVIVLKDIIDVGIIYIHK